LRISGFEDLRKFPDRPVVGVGAVVVDSDRVLLAKRAHEPLKGEWSLPGGAVEIGETLEAAVAREVLEETGLTIAVGPVIEVLDRIHADADRRIEFHYVIVDYLCWRIGTAEPVASSDAEEVRWAGVGDLARYRLTDKATSVIRKGFALIRAGATRPR
jgi:8-oxo-dGTP diphosphatase